MKTNDEGTPNSIYSKTFIGNNTISSFKEELARDNDDPGREDTGRRILCTYVCTFGSGRLRTVGDKFIKSFCSVRVI